MIRISWSSHMQMLCNATNLWVFSRENMKMRSLWEPDNVEYLVAEDIFSWKNRAARAIRNDQLICIGENYILLNTRYVTGPFVCAARHGKTTMELK